MTAPIFHSGYWWIPGEKASAVSGTATIDNEGRIELRTIGALRKHAQFGSLTLPVITGITSQSKRITLLDCRCREGISSSIGVEEQGLSARALIEGLEASSDSPLLFSSLSFRCSNLEAWVAKYGICIEWPEESDEIQITYTRPTEIKADLPEGFKLTIYCDRLGPSSPLSGKEVFLAEKDWIRLEPPTETTLDVLWKLVARLRDFLSLAIGRPVFISEIQGQSPQAKRTVGAQEIYNQLSIYLSRVCNKKHAEQQVDQADILLPLEAIEKRLGPTVSAWICNAKRIEPALDLYFSTLYEPEIHLQRHFLALAQALETYHRRTSDETELPHLDHETRLNVILASVPEEHQEWLKGRLAYSNEIGLRQRIKQICRLFSEELSGFIYVKTFSSWIVNTRNYLTHYDLALEEQAAKTSKQYIELIYKLRILLECCFLKELGLGSDEIKSVILRRIREVKWILEVNSDRTS